ncbi:TIGR03885 family FMN-dependent LLM class oxidoreductase [Aquabacterium sp. J223]|uniref:TIGR03885 family FMN-dependent LLM class oxidoreductase n=1 Tax=Aquabacterium sp. J223 TaxID=2898431 RepID=UPI0021ADDFFB|nr:TIGR03885 family FMN-dependent LLM class oxidoreductase [Aquabacterium sp. J223]UUX96998.1 TIGR03885 family FMN-dependent LLM class oxidoreductase [Aquabacterium sp. J223]
MTRFSYHVSHEQFAPSALLRFVQQAEAAGFDAAFSSDHLQPWGPQQGHSGFSWAWLGAALQATRRLQFSTITVPGGWRYSPVLLAQAAATLAELHPGRLPWIALGSGEAVNEAVVGPWPDKAERNRRLERGARAMRALLAGERVHQAGPPTVSHARLWVRPPAPLALVGAATSEATARWLGGWADGLLTLAPDVESLRALVTAFREGGGEDKPVHFKFDLSWAPSEDEAERQAHAQWRFNAVDRVSAAEWHQPEDFDAATRGMPVADIRRHVFVSADLRAHADRLRELMALGPASIDLHQVGLSQAAFIEAFGREVLPALRRP